MAGRVPVASDEVRGARQPCARDPGALLRRAAFADGYFGYLLVIGDDAIQGLLQGRPRPVKIGRTGVGELISNLDERRVASYRTGALMIAGMGRVDMRLVSRREGWRRADEHLHRRLAPGDLDSQEVIRRLHAQEGDGLIGHIGREVGGVLNP